MEQFHSFHVTAPFGFIITVTPRIDGYLDLETELVFTSPVRPITPIETAILLEQIAKRIRLQIGAGEN